MLVFLFFYVFLCCTEIYFPITAGIGQVSFAYTSTTSSGLSCDLLMLILYQRILHIWVDIISSLVAHSTSPDFLLRKLWHPPSTSLALEVDPSFTGISATSSSMQIIFRSPLNSQSPLNSALQGSCPRVLYCIADWR